MEKLSETELAMAETAIELLAKALGVDEKEIVKILEDGIDYKFKEDDISEPFKYFIKEMKATFDYY